MIQRLYYWLHARLSKDPFNITSSLSRRKEARLKGETIVDGYTRARPQPSYKHGGAL